MRIKITGKTTPRELCAVLLRILAEQGITELRGANLYLGQGPELLEVEAGLVKEIISAEKVMAKHKAAPPQGKSLKKAKGTPSSLAAVSGRGRDAWEPRLGAVKPKDAIDMDDGSIPF